jgi:hypothetical protein
MLNQTLTGSSTLFPAHLLPIPSWQAVQPTLICPGGRELAITLPGIGQKTPVWADSEVADFREQQQLEEEAAQRVFYSPAAVANHESIVVRTQQGAETLAQLFKEGRDAEAYELWEAGIWEGQ